ncbi:MAG TPA: hypothetical protein VK806_08240 [Bacteroidia bacterium]|jgi:hypothetical protein|nr:hypothetical protein [Bacteroidia bacterium]
MEASSGDHKEMERNQVILKINYVSSQNTILYHVGNTSLILIEIACYAVLLISICLAIYLPSGEIEATQQVSQDVTVTTSMHIKEIMEGYMIIKTMIVIFGIFMLLPAYICRTLRRKNHKLKEVNKLSGEYIKDNNIV